MESRFSNEEFEDFLKRSADGMRMRPSDRVWEGIAANQKKRRRRTAFATSAFLLLSSVLGYFLIDNSKDLTRSTLATLPAEVQEQNQASSSPSHTLTSETATEAKVINMKQRLSQAAEKSNKQNLSSQQASRNILSNKPLDINQSETNKTKAPSEAFIATPIDSDPVPSATVPTTAAATTENATEKLLSIESVTNLYKGGRKKTKLALQVFFTPTVSYRKLSENKSYIRSIPQPNLLSGTRGYSYLNVNDAVTHKPDMGLELGLATRYPISRNMNLRGGVQFNINRYDIKAFRSTPEIATIALNRGNNGVDFVGSVTDYRNVNGYNPDWLQNFYFQVSAPIGAEVYLFNNNKTQFGVAGTIQPTYLIGDRTYVLSTDYKNYSEVPWLTRRWNVNTAVETFVSYSTGKIQWQVGPQVRYQLLSSFIEKYPVKENLFDFGFKVGVSINKKDAESPK